MTNDPWTTADLSFLKKLIVTGPYQFPTVRNSMEDLALQHAEHLAGKGLVRALPLLAGMGPSYEITGAGRAAFDAAKSVRR